MDEEKLEDRLILSTKKSLYDPIEIVIDGQVYQSLKTTRTVLKKIDELDEFVDGRKDIDAVYKIVQFLFSIDMLVLEKLDKREVENIYIFVKRKFAEIEKERLKLVTASFGSTWVQEGQQVKKVPPKNQKRSGKKH